MSRRTVPEQGRGFRSGAGAGKRPHAQALRSGPGRTPVFGFGVLSVFRRHVREGKAARARYAVTPGGRRQRS